MELLNREFSLDMFFDNLGSAKNRILMLDYDGTLSPFTSDRDNAVPFPGVRAILEDIIAQCGSRLIVISGRPVRVLKKLLDLKEMPEIRGSHGAEKLSREDGYEVLDLSEGARDMLESIKKWSVENNLNKITEQKPLGIAFHWRGLENKQRDTIVETVEKEWSERISGEDLELEKFDGGIEIRPAGINKGSAVSKVLNEYTEGYAAAYLGDDFTDEDAFKALGERGLKILVRKEPRATAADMVISPPEELLDFLVRWLNAVIGN